MSPKPSRKARALRLLLLITFLFGGAFVYYYYISTWVIWITPPIGSGPAGPPVPEEPFETTWMERPVVLLGVGDSVTAGFGARPGWSYFDRLFRTPDGEHSDMEGKDLNRVFPNLTKMNLSVSGSTSLQHIDDQIPKLETYSEDTFGIVVMTTGGNDLIHWYGRSEPKEGAMYGATYDQSIPWIENFAERLDTMIQHIEEAFPGGCAIFLANIYDPSDGVGNPAAAHLPPWDDLLPIHRAYNDVITECVKKNENVHLVNIHEPFLGHGVHCKQFWREHYQSNDPHYWFSENLEDPNERGYDAIRRVFLLIMIQVLSAD